MHRVQANQIISPPFTPCPRPLLLPPSNLLSFNFGLSILPTFFFFFFFFPFPTLIRTYDNAAPLLSSQLPLPSLLCSHADSQSQPIPIPIMTPFCPAWRISLTTSTAAARPTSRRRWGGPGCRTGSFQRGTPGWWRSRTASRSRRSAPSASSRRSLPARRTATPCPCPRALLHPHLQRLRQLRRQAPLPKLRRLCGGHPRLHLALALARGRRPLRRLLRPHLPRPRRRRPRLLLQHGHRSPRRRLPRDRPGPPLAYDAASTGPDLILVNYGRLTAGGNLFGPGFTADPDAFSRVWQPDADFRSPTVKIKALSAGGHQIFGSNQPPNYFPTLLYETAVTTVDPADALQYLLPVDTRLSYMIWFHFAEIDAGVNSAGRRVFDVVVGGNNVTRIDIFKERGAGPGHREAHNLWLENYAMVPLDMATVPSQVVAMRALKESLRIPTRMGWNGDPCAPTIWDAWEGVTCHRSQDGQGLVVTQL
uniref:Malectin-like domain-containing protein n=1 Tax=Ananas comosus var. bracteatus TaxID=296719 RepID=A0A6V7QH86_ANACO|nr:unnamed protein product [Ananas comosus var. bracteatus]